MFRFLASLLKERELLLRSNGRVYLLRLTGSLQICMILIVGGGILWGSGMTLSTIVQSAVIGIKKDEIREARVEYNNMFKEAIISLSTLDKIASSINKRQAMLADKFESGIKLEERSEIKAQLDDTAEKIRSVQLARTKLAESIEKIRIEFALVEGQQSQIIATRSLLREKLARLETQLKKSRFLESKLDKEVVSLSTDLSRSRLKHKQEQNRREELVGEVVRLEENLATANQYKLSAENDLRSVLHQLAKAAGDPANAGIKEEPLRDRTVALLNRLSVLHAAHENVLEQLYGRAAGNIEEAEKLIEMTGIRVANIIKYVKTPTSNQGGPLVPAPGPGQLAEGLSGTVMNVDTKLGRWVALRRVLAVIPLMSPLDFYHLASPFGLRLDPITKKRAMHYGVDLAGWRGAPVYSTAPGKVVFAGRKGRYGKLIEIDHGFGIRTRYAHLLKISVRVGQQILHRQEIGQVGSTGRSTGPHVHYEIRFEGKPLNPRKFIMAGRYVFKG